MTKLNIGCGRDYRQGWWNCDISPDVKADRHLDIRTAMLPQASGTVDEIYISGVLEQIGENDHLVHVMQECYRVLKPGGKMRIIVPNAKYAIAHRDPMDVRKFTIPTFAYFLEGTQEHRDYGSVYGFPGWSKLELEENERHILIVDLTK